ncbi:MAG: RNA-binding domain-containing protein [Bacteroidota bacterium]
MLEALRGHQVFAGLSEEELPLLAPIVQRVSYQEGDILFDVNTKPEFLFYIEQGCFRLALSNNEYKTLKPGQLLGEIGILNQDFRSGVVYATEPSTLISICGTKLFDAAIIPPTITLKIVLELSKRITGYLRSREQISTKEIVESGESDSIEFKSTLRWNLYTNKKDKAMEKAVLKTLAAFMNSNGGILIIGVADDGRALGLENDRFPDHDKLLLHLTNLIKTRIGPDFLQYLHFSIEAMDEQDILRVDCMPASGPAYYKEDGLEHLFIRSGPSTTDLRLSLVHGYIKERFES